MIRRLFAQQTIAFFLSAVVGVSLTYLAVQGYTQYTHARENLSGYIVTERVDSAVSPDCPKFVKDEGVDGAIIIKDACTGVYWHRFDLPVKNTNGIAVGYTWQEAKDFCSGLAVVNFMGVNRSVFRLPTADELLSLVQTPCATEGSCSPLLNVTTKFPPDATHPNGESILPTEDNKYLSLYSTSPYVVFADGAYWSADEVQVDGEQKTCAGNYCYKAASSVNLKDGTVNNPLFSKNIHLNVRCVYDNPFIVPERSKGDFVTVTTHDINELQWWSKDTSTCNSGSTQYGNDAYKLTLGIRKNLTPMTTGDRNQCPIGLDDPFVGDYPLCTGVTGVTHQCVMFGCTSPKTLRRRVNWTFDIKLPADQTTQLSPVTCEDN